MAEPFENWIGNSSFSFHLPRYQIAWDSTSIGALKTCPRKYYYSIVLGAAPRETSVHLTFGLLYHAALERYDHAKSAGLDHAEATKVALAYALRATWNKTLRRPWASTDPNKNRRTLVRTVLWYLDKFEEDPCQTIQLANGKPAVELSFRVDLGYTCAATGEGLSLCGHEDRMVDFQGDKWVLDRKTSKHSIDQNYFAQFSPGNQFSGYIFGSRVGYAEPVKGLIVDAAQVLVGGSRFVRGFVERTEAQLAEWHKDLGDFLRQAEDYADRRSWPMNDQSCNNYGGCEFRSICSKDPSVRSQWLRADFGKREWDPLKVRGDI